MSDLSRPQAQWQDLPSKGSVFLPWSLLYDEDTGVVTLEESLPMRHGGLIQIAEDEDSQTWALSELVNGEVEATVAYSGDGTVLIFA